jgi:hypothetical protein
MLRRGAPADSHVLRGRDGCSIIIYIVDPLSALRTQMLRRGVPADLDSHVLRGRDGWVSWIYLLSTAHPCHVILNLDLDFQGCEERRTQQQYLFIISVAIAVPHVRGVALATCGPCK